VIVTSSAVPVPFDQLATADLTVERIYRGGVAGNWADDPLARLLPVGSQGGFRANGSPAMDEVKLAALFTSGAEPDWPDALDVYAGSFTYYGDNRSPGRDLHDTPRRGNLLLRNVFERAHDGPSGRARVPPFFLFDKPGPGRDVRFRGLLASRSGRLCSEEDLIAIWRTTAGQRFQNYRATFTVLDAHSAPAGLDPPDPRRPAPGQRLPPAWQTWVRSGIYQPLLAPPTVIVRSRQDQLQEPASAPLLSTVYEHFRDRPHDFEQFAADLWQLSQPNVDRIDVTRPWRDGGRDATGDYRLGPSYDPVTVQFALEAKCYAPGNSVGVRETSRLISRLRYRQFGVLVTTSYVHKQAYQEIREDGHPVVILAGREIVNILEDQALDTTTAIRAHLNQKYP